MGTQLVFFDTFSHEVAEELNLDLVQFPSPVVVDEVRVIPLGARVQANFPGGVRLGATNPTQFALEFFVNDLSKPGASTFESLGELNYEHNGRINLPAAKKIATDGLVLRGFYNTITLAVYGTLSQSTPEQLALQGAEQHHVANNQPPAAQETNASQPIHHENWTGDVAAIPNDNHTNRNNSDYPARTYDGGQRGSVDRTFDGGNLRPEWRSGEEANGPSARGRTMSRSPRDDRIRRSPLPRNRSSISPSSSGFGRRTSRTPPLRGRSRSPNCIRRSPTPQSPSRNGGRESDRSKTPMQEPTDDALEVPDDVSDISDGDIEDVPAMDVDPEPVLEKVIGEAEDISDNEEEWSDYGEVATDVDFEIPEDYDDQIKMFNYFNFEVLPFQCLEVPHASKQETMRTFITQRQEQGLPRVPSPPEHEKLTSLLDQYEEKFVDRTGITNEWVELIEALTKVVEVGLPFMDDQKRAKETLLNAASLCTNVHVAYQQPMPTFKVRHIKSGLKFLSTLKSCGEDILTAMLAGNLQGSLMAVYNTEHMAVSLKLIALEILEFSLNSDLGMKLFLNQFTLEEARTQLATFGLRTFDFWSPSSSTATNLYQELLRNLSREKSTRTKLPLTSIGVKVNLYEVLQKLKGKILNVIDGDQEDEAFEQAMKDIQKDFEYVLETYEGLGSRTFKQSFRDTEHLPSDEKFSAEQRGFFSLLHNSNFLSCFLALMVTPSTAAHVGVSSTIRKCLKQFISNYDGMLFVCSQTDVINSLVKILVEGKSANVAAGTTSGNDDDVLDDVLASSSDDLFFVYCVYAVHAIDQLGFWTRGVQRAQMENMNVLDVMQTLFSMTFTNIGRIALAHVLATRDNIQSLVNFVKHSDDTRRDMKKSGVRGYAGDILLMTVRNSDNVDYLKFVAAELFEIGQQNENISKLTELKQWMEPAETQTNLTSEGIPVLCEIIKKNVENVSPMSQELVTAVRILRSLSCRKTNILQMFSLDLMEHYLLILNKICGYHEQPHLHTATFVGHNGFILMSVLDCIVATMKQMLTFSIQVRDTAFKDLRSVTALMKAYTLATVVPTNSLCFDRSQQVCGNIVGTLLAFTQPFFNIADESMSDSLWTMLLKEVFGFIVSTPHKYVPGLRILSELLPLPLPVNTRSSLSEEDCQQTVNNRKLWSAHLFPLESAIVDMIGILGGCSSQLLLSLLRRVCIQLADLSAPTAIIVSKGILTAFKTEVTTGCDDSMTSSSHLAKILGFMSWLLTNPTIKTACMHHCSEEGEFADVYVTFSKILLNHNDQPIHMQAQEYIATIIQSLCDIENTLFNDAAPDLTKDSMYVLLANALPSKDRLVLLISSLLEHICAEASRNFSSILPTLRTFVMLLEHNHGLQVLRSCFDKRPDTMGQLFRKLQRDFNKDSSDCISTLSTALDLVRLLTTVPAAEEEEVYFQTRTQALSSKELAVLLDWKEEAKEHPLMLLNDQIKDFCSSDDTLENIYVHLESLIKQISDPSNSSETPADEVEPLPATDPLLKQFSTRPIFVISQDCDEDERLTAGYWLPPNQSTLDFSEGIDADVEGINLMEISERYLPDFDINTEVRLVCDEKTLETDKKKKTKKSAMETKALQNKNLISSFKAGGPVTLKTRTFHRSNQRMDAFRSRPPNTSRPPSLHVDDFMVLQSRGQQPTGPTGYNKQSVEAAKKLFAQREAQKNSIVGFREATKEPVFGPGRSRPEGGGGRGGRPERGRPEGGRGGRTSSRGRGGRDKGGVRGWSPRGLDRDQRQSQERRFSGGGRRGGWGGDKKDRGPPGRKGLRDERPRHLRSLTR